MGLAVWSQGGGRLWKVLRGKGLRYWLTALIVLVMSVWISPYVYDHLRIGNVGFADIRSATFQKLLAWGPTPPEPTFVKLVLIEDDEYWGTLAGRTPLKRDYLGRIVETLVRNNVHSIALDFDLRLPQPDTDHPSAFEIPADYRAETECLVCAIQSAANAGKKIILSTPIADREGYRREADVYQAYGLCGGRGKLRPRAETCNERQPPACPRNEAAIERNVSCGYIALPFEPLEIPGQIRLKDGSDLNSFSLAIARSSPTTRARGLRDAETVRSMRPEEARYTNFISEKQFRDHKAVFSVADLLQGNIDGDSLQSSSVIVGAHWSRRAIGRGGTVDLHSSPVGLIPGPILHANFTEALLGGRAFKKTSKETEHFWEIAFGIFAALAFALIPGVIGKIGVLLGLLVGLFLIQWIALHNFGIFFDALVPLLGLAMHSLYERILGGHGPHGVPLKPKRNAAKLARDKEAS